MLSAALQVRLTAGMCQCKHTYGDVLFKQLSSDTAGICQFEDSCEGLLFKQLCSDPTPVHCSTGLGKMHPQCSVLLCKAG